MIDQTSRDLATFHNPQLDETVNTLTNALQREADNCQHYGITITAKLMQKEIRDTARQFNLSRPRGVSLNRPSPQLSRDKLATLRVIARMNILYRLADEALNERQTI